MSKDNVYISIVCNDNKVVPAIINKCHSFYKSELICELLEDYSANAVIPIKLDISSDVASIYFSNSNIYEHFDYNMLKLLIFMDDNRIPDILTHFVDKIFSNDFGPQFNQLICNEYKQLLEMLMMKKNIVLHNGLFCTFTFKCDELLKYYNGSIPDNNYNMIGLYNDYHNKRLIISCCDYVDCFYNIALGGSYWSRKRDALRWSIGDIGSMYIDMEIESNIPMLSITLPVQLQKIVIQNIGSNHAKCFQNSCNKLNASYADVCECNEWKNINGNIDALKTFMLRYNITVNKTVHDYSAKTIAKSTQYAYKVPLHAENDKYISIYLYY